MAQRQSLSLPVGLFLLACVGAAGAQSASPAATPVSRIAGDWTSSAPIALPVSRPPLSFPELSISGIDEGAAPANENLSRMVLLLAPSAAQQQGLAAEITSLQNPSSPNYHQWLTPATFASAYANSASDVSAVAAWLQSQGFQVAPLSAGRGWIEFSGTVAQAEQAFHTQINLISTANGSARPVVMSNISVPAALEPLIAGLVSLDGFVSRPALTAPQPLSVSAAELAAQTSPAGAAAFTPQLEAQLVDLQPLAKSGITGAGQTIAIAARSNVNTADVAAFRAAFGLSASPLSVVLNGADPGLTDGQAEATLAASWAGAAAPGAQILLAPAATTNATDGVDLSLAAIVDRDLASTVDIGYSACEAGMGAAHQAFYSAVYRQAAAEGITVIAAAGDSGAAACAVAGGAPVSTGYGVNALASTQWNTAVGVAAFGATGPGTTSAAWSAWSPIDPADPAYAGGGGSSTVNALPVWQPLPANLPAGTSASNRLLPDVSLPTAIDSSANPGVAFCLSADSTSTGCTLVRSGGSGAAAAYFAGIAALMAQQHGAEGNLAPLLYQLNNQSGIYSDVQQGSAQLKCAAGSAGCGADGQIGFTAGPGFDLATGLGVPDANALVRAEPQATYTSQVTVDNNIAAGQTIYPSGSLVLSATVDSGSGGTVPTGTVEFYDQTTGVNLGVDTLTAATATTATVQQTITGQLAPGVHSIIAEYNSVNNSGNYPAANSGAVSVTVQLSSTTTTVTLTPPSPAAGSNFFATAVVTSANAGTNAPAPTGTVQFSIDNNVNAGSGLLVAGTSAGASTNASATATLIAPTTVGTHAIYATYQGNTTYATSTSPTVPITVAKGATTVTVAASPATLTPNTPEALTATVLPTTAPAGPTVAISGTVNFYDGATLLGQATISSNSATLSGVPLADNVAHSITAVYSGDGNWLTSTSAVLPLAATTLPVTVVLTSNSSTMQPGGAVYLTATVTPNSLPPTTGEQNPSGTVVFYQGATVLGMATLTPAAAGDASTATFTAPTLPGGQDQLTAFYEGDPYFDPGTSAAITLTVEAFTITPAATNPPTSLTVVQGASGSESFVITGQGGFNNLVQVLCTAPAGDNMTCTPTPQQVTPPATVTFVVQTSTTPMASNAPAGRGPVWPRAAGGAALAGLVFFLLPFGRRARTLLRANARRTLVLLLLLIGLGGAGIGCTSTDPLATFGTPLGITTFKVTATAYVDNTVVSQNVYFTVNVVSQ